MKPVDFKLELVNLNDDHHQLAFIGLMNQYRTDPMGDAGVMNKELELRLINDLKNHPTYLGFFIKINNEYVALANCFTNYSTFKAKPLLNIHDFIVSNEWRGKKVGEFLMHELEKYLKTKGFCRINLEVRHDNYRAMGFYRKTGFGECNPDMYFWEKHL